MLNRELNADTEHVQHELRKLWRRKWLVTTLALVLFLGAVAYIYSVTPVYQATALVDVSPAPLLALTDSRTRTDRYNASDPVLIRSEVEILSSDQIARQVVADLSLAQNPAFSGAMPPSNNDDGLEMLVRRYHALVSIRNDAHSTIATISALSTDPRLAADIANTTARAYLKGRLERKLENTDVSLSKLVSPAGIPSRPTYPKKVFQLTVSFLGSFLLSALAIATISYVRVWKGDLHALANDLGIVAIATVPLYPTGRRSRKKLAALCVHRVNEVRDSVLRAAEGEESTIIVITSSLPREGKSRLSMSLAEAMALSGRRTLLVDADLFKPSLSDLFYVQRTSGIREEVPLGLESVLAFKASLAEVIRHGEFDLLPAFKVRQLPANGLSAEALAGILKEARKSYRFIIIDTPPVAIVPDALSIVSLAEQTIFLIGSRAESLRVLPAGIRKLRAAQANMIGIVHTGRTLNDIELAESKDTHPYYFS